MTTRTACLGGVVLTVFCASTVMGQAPDADKCQKTVAKEAAKYAQQYQKNAAKCLQKVSTEVVKKGGTAAGAAKACRAKLRKIENSEDPTKALAAKMRAKIEDKCSPVSDAALVGAPLQVGDLAGWCANFGGDGTIDADPNALGEWLDCIEEAATCQARQQLSVEYPQALAWLVDVRDDILALDTNINCGSPCTACDDAKVKDACNALDDMKAAIDGDPNDLAPDINCGPGLAGSLVPGTDPILPKTGQTTSYGTGDDGNVQAGQERSFTDNGDGTITDNTTGLMWEKKEDFDNSSVFCETEGDDVSCENPHDADNRYEWCDDSTPEDGVCDNGGNPFDGPVVTLFLDQLNNRCNDDVSEDCTTNGDADCTTGVCGFAGYRDWRLPNFLELQTLWDMNQNSGSAPTTFSAFNTGCSVSCTLTDADTCSCTASNLYWSSTTYADFPFGAWFVNFFGGGVGYGGKALDFYVRAVRSGL